MSNKLNSSIGQMSIKKKNRGKVAQASTKWRSRGRKSQLERSASLSNFQCASKENFFSCLISFLCSVFLVRTQIVESLFLKKKREVVQSPKAVTKLDVQFPLLFMFLHRDVSVSTRKPFWTLAAIRVSVKLRPIRRFVKSIQI